jgi:hypothetical protein
MHGASIVPTFDDAAAPPPRRIQYFEQMGHRGMWSDGWKITTYHLEGRPFDDDEWALFRLDDDFSECHDLSAEHPEVLRELVDAWWSEAGRYDVLPLDDRTIELFGGTPRPATVHARSDYVYFPPLAHIPADATPPFGGRSWTVTAVVDVDDDRDPSTPVEGVLYARGSHNVGHAFYVKDGHLRFEYNALCTRYRVAGGPLALEAGRHELVARFDRGDTGGMVTVAADGVDLAAVEVTRLVRMLGSTGLDVGRDALSPVSDDYDAPFPFTATIDRITFSIRSRAEADEVRAMAKAEMSKE